MLPDSVSTVSKTFVCRVGLLPIGVFIESPRTGKRLRFGPLLKNDLPRVWGRILQKCSVGQKRVEFTRDELHKLKQLDDERNKPIDVAAIVGGADVLARRMRRGRPLRPTSSFRRGW